MYPKQILLGDVPLPLLPNSSLTFRVNSAEKICFRIRLSIDDSQEPLNIGIPLSQVESVSIKDHSAKHPEPALLFLLKKGALERFIQVCNPLLGELHTYHGRKRKMLTYLTVILGMDPHLEQPNPVYCRVSLMANKFTFPFGTAKKILLKDLPIMWQEVLDKQYDRRLKTGIHHDRERMAEMDDEAWDWLMSFLNVKWDKCPSGGRWFVRDKDELETSVNEHNENLAIKREASPQDDLLAKPMKQIKYSDSDVGSPNSISSESSASIMTR